MKQQVVSFLTIIALIIICLIQIDTNKTLRATNKILKQTDDILKTKNHLVDTLATDIVVASGVVDGMFFRYRENKVDTFFEWFAYGVPKIDTSNTNDDGYIQPWATIPTCNHSHFVKQLRRE